MTVRKIKFKYILFILTIILLLAIASSCSLFQKETKQVIAPRIDVESLPRIERVNPDYTNEEGEDDYYTDPDAIIPVKSGEKVYIKIDYINKDKLPINKVVVKGGGKEREFTSFVEGSNTNKTIIEFAIDEVSSNKVMVYEITKIFYKYGNQVIPMRINSEYMELSVNIDPEFKLTFDHQNADIRTKTPKTTHSIDIKYAISLADIIPTISTLETHQYSPTKQGGWSFRGYYTKENGNGRQMKNTDYFYFWGDVTLYAFFERMYEFKVDDAVQPIEYEENGQTKFYDKVATITKKTSAGDQQSNIEIFDTIADGEGIYPIVGIGMDAFLNTFSLDNLKIGKYVSYIGKSAFASSKVMNVEFHPEGVLEKIDEKAFYGTDKLGTGIGGFTLPRTVKYLGDRCFEKSGWGKMIQENDVSPKKTLIIYDNIQHIGDWCFINTSFEEVIFEAGVKFKADAVKGQNYVENIGGQQVTADYDYYLGWCLFKSSNTIKRFQTKSNGNDGLEIIPDGMFDLFTYNSISNVGLTRVLLGEGLKKIGKGAFHYQKLLQSIELPDSLEDICSDNEYNGSGKIFEGTRNEKSEFGAFAECHSLATINFKSENSQLKIIGCKAFYNNRALKEIHFKTKVLEEYGDGPFEGCEKLMEVYFDEIDNPENIPQPIEGSQRTVLLIRRSGADFFYPVQNFKVFVKDQVVEGIRQSFKKYAHDNMKNSLPVYGDSMIKVLMDGNEEIGKIALETTTDISLNRQGWLLGYVFGDTLEVQLPDEYEGTQIVTIGPNAFNKVVQKITLPSYISFIGNHAFAGCEDLSEIIYGREVGGQQVGVNNLKIIGEQAYYKTAITSFLGGINLETIGSEAFWACENLIWVDLKDSKTLSNALMQGAFYKCKNLRYVRLPNSYSYMHDSTFSDCERLRYIVFTNESPGDGFLFSSANATYFHGVPEGVISAYVPSETARLRYENLQFLPRALKGRFSVRTNDIGPQDLLGF